MNHQEWNSQSKADRTRSLGKHQEDHQHHHL
jgi:hypothetical protein